MSTPDGTTEPSRSAPSGRRLQLRTLRNPWVAAPVALVVIAGGWLLVTNGGGASSSAATTTTQLVAATKGPIGNTVSAEGTIAALQTANLSFPSSGTVTAVNVKAGDTVTAGQVLATLDSSQLAASLSSAQANLASAQAKLSDDEAAGASSAQLSADQSSVQSATDALTNAQQSFAGATVTAPFDGTIALVNVTPGEALSSSGTGGVSQTGSASGSGNSASAPSSSSGFGGNGGGGNSTSSSASSSSSSSAAIQEITKGRYTVSVSVPASDLAAVQVGQNATVTVTTSSANNRFGGGFGGGGFGNRGFGGGTNGASGTTTGVGAQATGAVTSVSQVASTTNGVAGYPVVVTFDADSNSFAVGGTVTTAIATNAKNDVIQVPTRALSTANGKTVVTVSKDGKVGGPTETRVVATGITAGGQTEITSGLKAGEQVVITLPTFFGTGGAGGTTGRNGGNGGTGTGGFGGGNRTFGGGDNGGAGG